MSSIEDGLVLELLFRHHFLAEAHKVVNRLRVAEWNHIVDVYELSDIFQDVHDWLGEAIRRLTEKTLVYLGFDVEEGLRIAELTYHDHIYPGFSDDWEKYYFEWRAVEIRQLMQFRLIESIGLCIRRVWDASRDMHVVASRCPVVPFYPTEIPPLRVGYLRESFTLIITDFCNLIGSLDPTELVLQYHLPGVAAWKPDFLELRTEVFNDVKTQCEDDARRRRSGFDPLLWSFGVLDRYGYGFDSTMVFSPDFDTPPDRPVP